LDSDSEDLVSMLKEDLYAERIAIESYSEIVRWLSDNDPTTRKLIEDILKVEEEHAEDLKSLLEKMS
jgi:bacterioferritin